MSRRTPLQPRAVPPARPNVGTLLLHAYRRFEAELFAELHRAGHAAMRPKHGRVLANIDREGTRATDLAARADMTKAAMGELVDELEALGYVRRAPDTKDLRAKRVVPTREGLEVAALARRIIQRIEERWAAELGRQGLGTLLSALSVLADGRPGGAGSGPARERAAADDERSGR